MVNSKFSIDEENGSIEVTWITGLRRNEIIFLMLADNSWIGIHWDGCEEWTSFNVNDKDPWNGK